MYLNFFFSCYGDHRDLHSFPTRRSSDLRKAGSVRRAVVVLPVPRRGTLPDGVGVLAAPAERSEEQRLNSSHVEISYAVFCLKKKNDLKVRILYVIVIVDPRGTGMSPGCT